MRKGLFSGSLAVAVCSGVALFLYINAPASRVITGYIMTGGEGKSNHPVVGATVEFKLESDSNKFKATVTTNEKGWFTSGELPEGQYKITVTSPSGETAVARKVDRGTTLTIRP